MPEAPELSTRPRVRGDGNPTRGRAWNIALCVVLLIVLFGAPSYLTNDYYIRIGVLICIYGAASVGWNLLGGYANQVSLGHAVFFGIGAYAVMIVQTSLGWVPWIAMILGVVVSAVVALLIGWPCFQLSGHYFALGTLALLEIAGIVASVWKDFTGGPVGLTLPILDSNLANLQFDSPGPYLYISAVFLVLTLGIAALVRRSRLGLRLDAIRLNPHAALLAGVNLLRTKMAALVIGAAIVSVAGSLYGTLLQFVDPDTAFSFNTTVNMALFAIVGGVRLWWGPILGAALLVPLAEVASLNLTGHLSALAQVAYGLLLVLLVILQPRGLGGWLHGRWRRLTMGRA